MVGRAIIHDETARVMILITEDWFALSHFKSLIGALVAAGHKVVIATTVSSGAKALEALGARVIAFNFDRASQNLFRQAALVGALRELMRVEKPAVIHAIALKPIVLAGLAFSTSSHAKARTKLVMHLTGVGFAGTAAGPGRLLHAAALQLIGRLLQRPGTALFAENLDDAALVWPANGAPRTNVTILGGAGVDVDRFPAMPLPVRATARAAFVGRMVWTKGVDVLVKAHQLLGQRGVALDVHLGGDRDPANPRSVSAADLEAWNQTAGITWLGRIDDIAGLWRDTNFAVVPSRGGEGLPRALLEAAACARPLLVSDVPGCRSFVRHEVEGLIVPPGDAPALADALERLIRNPKLAASMGRNARARVSDGFTEAHVAEAVVKAYRRLLHLDD